MKRDRKNMNRMKNLAAQLFDLIGKLFFYIER